MRHPRRGQIRASLVGRKKWRGKAAGSLEERRKLGGLCWGRGEDKMVSKKLSKESHCEKKECSFARG